MRTLVLVSLAFFIFLSEANAAVGIGAKKISTIILHDSGQVIVEIEGAAVSTNCGDKNRFVLDSQSAHLERMYAGILAAQQSGSTVNLYYDGACTSISGVDYPKITNIYLYSD